jgi:DNA-binding ferritin-like protein (Dps family)
MRSRRKLWAGLIILFGAGALTGIVAGYVYSHAERTTRSEQGPAAHYERIMKRLTQDLSLTAQQQTEIEPIVTRAHVAVLELRFAHQAEVEQILGNGMAEIKTKLSASQQTGLDKMYKELEQRWQASRHYLAAQKQTLTTQ